MNTTKLQQFSDAFTEVTDTATSRVYTVLKNDSPNWMRDTVRELHGEFCGPDDRRYEMIERTVDFILSYDDPDNAFDEVHTLADCYNSDLLAWVSSNGFRSVYVDEVMADHSAKNFFQLLTAAQVIEYEEIFGLIVNHPEFSDNAE